MLLAFFGVLNILLLIYIPFSNVLEESLIINFKQIAIANYNVLDESLQRSIEGAESLSRRSMIKNTAEDFQNGLMTFEELADYTQPKFEDGVKAFEYLVLAERFIGNHRVTSHAAEYPLSDLIIPKYFFEDKAIVVQRYTCRTNISFIYIVLLYLIRRVT